MAMVDVDITAGYLRGPAAKVNWFLPNLFIAFTRNVCISMTPLVYKLDQRVIDTAVAHASSCSC